MIIVQDSDNNEKYHSDGTKCFQEHMGHGNICELKARELMGCSRNTGKDQVGSLLGQHNDRTIEVAADNTWHD